MNSRISGGQLAVPIRAVFFMAALLALAVPPVAMARGRGIQQGVKGEAMVLAISDGKRLDKQGFKGYKRTQGGFNKETMPL
jgi:hypothetical protein